MKYVKRICLYCQHPFMATTYAIDHGWGKYCSGSCRSRMIKRLPVRERFYARIDTSSDPHGCWLWTRGLTAQGYGTMSVEGRVTLMHRLSYELHVGPIPAGLHVLHRCPGGAKPACCNPAHLAVGTPLDNSHDVLPHERHTVRGSSHPRAVLTEDAVIQMRALAAEGWRIHAIATHFQQTFNCVRAVLVRETWKHLPEPFGAMPLILPSRPHGIENNKTKLTPDAVMVIRQRLTHGESRTSLACDYKVTWHTIDAIAKRLTWKHLP